MNRSILVPLDGTPESEAILPEVRRIVSPRDQVHFLHVVPSVHSPAGLEASAILTILDQAAGCLQAARDKGLPGQPGLDLVLPGDPAQGILGVALEKNINLIAMTTHARRGLSRLLLGSVASEVVRKAQLPVLLTRPGQERPSRPLQKILLAVEGTETPEHLLHTVRFLTREPKAEIILFHASPPVPDPAPQWALSTKLSTAFTPLRRLEEQADALEEQGYVAWPIVSVGEPAEEILRQCRKLDVDLVAVATHGRTGLERLLEGSVAEAVLKQAPVPVLLQKPLEARKPVPLRGSHE